MTTTRTLSHRLLSRIKQITVVNLVLFFTNMLVFLNGGNVLLQIITLTVMLLLPGLIISKLFTVHGTFGQRIGYVVAFGIAHLILLGLVLNTVLPLYHILDPLRLLYFFIGFNISTITLFVLSILLKRSYTENFHIHPINPISAIFTVVACAFPLVMLAGVALLNNGGSGNIVFGTLIAISVYIVAVVLCRKWLQDFVFPLSIFLITLALLFMYSGRNPFLMGWDIQNEFRVYQKTSTNFYWNPFSKGDIYNATLAVSIFPTLMGNILTIKSFLIFKYLYPILFAFSSLAIFYLLRSYLSRIAAYLGAFFCICQLSFVSMPSLARQEVGYMMFAFMLFMLFDKLHSRFVKNNVLLFLGIVMVVTHYSTTYVGLLLFLVTWGIGMVVQGLFWIFPKLRVPKATFQINIFAIIILILITIFWYGLYTQATENVQSFVTSIQKNIFKIHTSEGKNQQSLITITGSNREATAADLQKYVDGTTLAYRPDENNLSFFSRDVVDRYPVHLMHIEQLPGDPHVKDIANKMVLYVRQLLKVFMVFGLLYMAWLFVWKRKLFVSAEILIMGYVYLLFIAAAIFIPSVAIFYNIERLYQQGLMILVFFVIGLVQAVRMQKLTTLKYLIVTLVFILYFFSHHGVVAQIVGGPPSVNFNNFGQDFGEYYIYSSELAASQWYFLHRNPKNTVYADTHATLRLASQGRVDNIISAILPTVIFRNGYVYASHKNLTSGYVQTTVNGITINYSFPKQFLDENKNLIYSNNSTHIYQ